jgi:hypothetical protein
MGMMTKLMTAGAFAAAMTAGTADALTYGTIPQGSQTNEGIDDVYGAGTTSRGGWYGAVLYLLAGAEGADLTFTYLGSEAGYNNEFWFGGVKLFETGGNQNCFTLGCQATTIISDVASGLLDFYFTSPEGVAANGSNPDDGLGNVDVGPNFFVSFDNGEHSTGGTSLVLWFDDNGANNDDNHDDMAIRISIANGVAEVPVPAAGFLLIGALGGLAALRRRKTA